MSDELDLIARAARQHHLVTVDDVRLLGISAKRWRSMRDRGLWVAVSPSHYRHRATPVDLRMRVYAGLGWLGREAALFGTTGLWWLGVDVPEPDRPEFLVPRSWRGVATGLRVHTTTRWYTTDLVHHEGARTSTAARAIIDMAASTHSAHILEQAIDSAISQRRTSLTTLRKRLDALDGKGRHGCTLMRELLLDSGGESFLERRFLRLVRLEGLPAPKCQVTFRGSSNVPLRVDFVFGQLVVEVSGRLGHSSDRDRQRSARRKVTLENQGFRVIEFTTADVIDDPDYVRQTLRAALCVSTSSPRPQKKY
jgi:very-short-patch-repair endonuclease